MKNKLIVIIGVFSFLFVDATINYIDDKKNNNAIEPLKIIYISYIEYLDNFYGLSKTINEKKIDKMIENIKSMDFNCIMLHVSPFSDAIYKSKYFPYSYTLTGQEGKNPGFDYLEYFIKRAHQKNIQIHAWINPYRIRLDQKKEEISINNPAYKLLDTSSILVSKEGIYYNPASEISKNIIISQVKEILENYSIDGIHFDDYFYVQDKIDATEYQNYIDGGGTMNLSEFRFYHTNDLIKRVYKLIKEINLEVIFSISPDGNINNNYNYHYADVKTWLQNEGYVDIIMPQLYYGFENQYRAFEKAFSEWNSLITSNTIKLVPVLSFYKTGRIDDQAGTGKNEWVTNNNIIARQINFLKNNNVSEFALFRYDFLFNEEYLNEISKKEKSNLAKNM